MTFTAERSNKMDFPASWHMDNVSELIIEVEKEEKKESNQRVGQRTLEEFVTDMATANGRSDRAEEWIRSLHAQDAYSIEDVSVHQPI